MKKKIICILVMTLLTATTFPAVGMMNANENFKKISIDDYLSLQQTISKNSIMSTWSQQAKLIASDGALLDYYGSTSIDGEFAIIGAYGNDDLGAESGCAYI